MSADYNEFDPVEEEARSEASFRPGSRGRPPGERAYAETAQAVQLEGGPVAEEIVRLLGAVFLEVRAISMALSILVGQDVRGR